MARSASLGGLSDEQLIHAARSAGGGASAGRYLDALYERYYPKVATWCLSVCRDRDEAADLAQEVFLRVHQRLDSFRGESRFSTWLYTVTRRLAIDCGMAVTRLHQREIAQECCPEQADPAPAVEEAVHRNDLASRVRTLIPQCLDSLEVTVCHLRFVEQLTLPAITERLALRNRSGAKAYLVSAKRKLKRALASENWGDLDTAR